jgi:ABC-2 type transport system ATP-binding protein
MVTVDNLLKTYGDITAVDHVSFAVARGEVVGLLGPNGAGKTTTMRILACFMPATAGRAEIAGHDVLTDSLNVRRCVGYMPENVPLYPEMRVDEYLRYRGRLKGLRGRKLDQRIDQLVDACELGQVHRRICDQLSKGNRQRVGLAEALIGDPDLLILDEPTIGLDPNQVRRVRELIREVGRDRTIILSTHILSEVEMVCERVIIMHQGRVAAEDTMDNLRGRQEAYYVCELSAAPGDVAATLDAVKGVADVTTDEQDGWTSAKITALTAGLDLRGPLYAAIKAKGWDVRRFDTVAPTLEDVFVEITAR